MRSNLGILGDDASPSPVRVIPDPPAPPGPFPVRAGFARPTDSYPYYRWQVPVPFPAAHYPPPPLGAYYQNQAELAINGLRADQVDWPRVAAVVAGVALVGTVGWKLWRRHR